MKQITISIPRVILDCDPDIINAYTESITEIMELLGYTFGTDGWLDNSAVFRK